MSSGTPATAASAAVLWGRERRSGRAAPAPPGLGSTGSVFVPKQEASATERNKMHAALRGARRPRTRRLRPPAGPGPRADPRLRALTRGCGRRPEAAGAAREGARAPSLLTADPRPAPRPCPRDRRRPSSRATLQPDPSVAGTAEPPGAGSPRERAGSRLRAPQSRKKGAVSVKKTVPEPGSVRPSPSVSQCFC